MSESKADRLRRQAEQREDAALEAARLQAAPAPTSTRCGQQRVRRRRHQDEQAFRAGVARLQALETRKEPTP